MSLPSSVQKGLVDLSSLEKSIGKDEHERSRIDILKEQVDTSSIVNGHRHSIAHPWALLQSDKEILRGDASRQAADRASISRSSKNLL